MIAYFMKSHLSGKGVIDRSQKQKTFNTDFHRDDNRQNIT